MNSLGRGILWKAGAHMEIFSLSPSSLAAVLVGSLLEGFISDRTVL